MAKNYAKKVAAEGFEVRLLHEAYDGYPALYHVEGHGVNLSLTDDATDIWEGLLAHADAARSINPSAAAEPEPPPDSKEA